MRHFLPLAFASAALACSFSAPAQTPVYKLEAPDGRTVYSDKVLPQTKVKKKITESELTVIAPLAAAKEGQAQSGSKLDELWRSRNAAQSELDAARSAKANGEEPLPGERIGTASRRSRLNDAYWARQDALQRGIDNAQRRLERAEQNLRDAGS